MAEISSTLSFQDRMSSVLDSINRRLDDASTSAKIAKDHLQQLEATQKAYADTVQTAIQVHGANSKEVTAAMNAYDRASKEYDKGAARLEKYNKQVISAEMELKKQEQILREYNGTIDQTNNKNNQAAKGFESMSGKIVTLSAAFQLFNQAKAFISGINAKINEFVGYARIQTQAEDQLAIITKQRMSLNDDEVRSLYALASAQQRVGVVGDEATIAGMASISAFTTQKKSIEALTPAMDNLAVKMYGYDVNASNMEVVSKALGKAMQGDIGQLSRMGIKIDEVTKKRLMSLREEERAVELARIIKSVTGDMNEEMAKTPYGQITQAQNRLGDSYERLGNALLPLQAQMTVLWSNIVETVVNNLDKIIPIVTAALLVITAGFIALKAEAIGAALSAAGAWISATAPLWIVIGVIALISAGLNALGLSFQEQAENILISFNWIITGLKNILIAIQNTWTFAENVVKNFTDLNTLILAKFFGWVASKLEGIAKLIDMVFKTNLSEAVNNFANQASKAEGVLTKRIQGNVKGYKSFEANDYYTNQAKAQNFMGKLSGINTRDLLGKVGMGAGVGTGLEGLTTNTSGGRALKTQNQGDIGIKEEDMELLHDLATEKFAQYYQQLTPTLTIPNMVIHETADVNEVLGAITSSITGFVRSSTYNTDTGSQQILPA
jgi:SpoU rRNA methylase family enzyme